MTRVGASKRFESTDVVALPGCPQGLGKTLLLHFLYLDCQQVTIIHGMPMQDSSDLLIDRLEENAKKYASKRAVAWIAPGPNAGVLTKSITYAEMQQATDHLASYLIHHPDIQRGDRVILVYPPSLDFMTTFIACLKAGIVAVPVFPPNPLRRDTLQMFSKIVKGCGAHVALTNTEYSHAKKIANIRDALRIQKTSAAWPDDLTWIATDTILAQKQSKTPSSIQLPSKPNRSDLAFLQYTSGSTSDPKGVQITHGNLAHNLHIITNELQAAEHVVVVSWLPQYHDMGLIGSYLGTLYCGGSGYYLSPLSFLQRPMLWIEAVSHYKATHLQAPNFAFKLTARKFNPEEYATSQSLDLSSLQHVINAAEPVDEESMQAFHTAFGRFGLPQNVIVPTYGLAEHTVFVCSGGKQRLTVDKEALETQGKVIVVDTPSGAAATTGSMNVAAVSRLVGCGFPSKQNVNVKIVDGENRRELKEDVVGEIWVDSPSKAAGYYGMEAETREDFHARLADDNIQEEYLRTGDLGFLHNGELFIAGRSKDLIIIGGRNYYPQDLEATAEATSDLIRPGCTAAFTIDTTHEGGEEVAMVMELKEVKNQGLCQALATSIRSAINQEHSLGINELVFIEPRTIPKTSSGKIARSWCRKAFLNGSLKVIFRQSFKTSASSFETEARQSDVRVEQIRSHMDANAVRGMEKSELLTRLTTDIAIMASIPESSVDKSTNLVSILDSLTISQFKGLLESKYFTKLSDEYLFRESTTPQKLVEVVKLGFAPDDGEGEQSSAHTTVETGKASGLAGALGCPPGVKCVIL